MKTKAWEPLLIQLLSGDLRRDTMIAKVPTAEVEWSFVETAFEFTD